MQHAHAYAFNTSVQRFTLSPRGYAIEAMCPGRAFVTQLDGSWDRLNSERAQWAYSHGLEPVDGAYLHELRRRRLTASQLGEALAVFGESSQRIERCLHRLADLGLIEPTLLDTDPELPAQLALDGELDAALEDLHRVLTEVDGTEALDRRQASVILRRAMARVIAARRICGEILPANARSAGIAETPAGRVQ
ncbi:MAG: hypothetical protein ACE37F_24035 [Nannocystaceae bacterium]|nr:MarR family transcriptional regulator [bacterium]